MSPAESERSPVLALTVVDGDSLRDGELQPESRVLVVARDPRANPTHPSVVSVPTQRLPAALSRSMVAASRPADSASLCGQRMARVVDSRAEDSHDPLVYAIESLLARKLGLADALERQEVAYRAALHAVVRGAAMYDNLGSAAVYEEIEMLSTVVELSDPERQLPLRTGSYSLLAWTEVRSLLATIRSKDPTLAVAGLDPIEFCVHGVCLEAAEASLTSLLGRASLADLPAVTPVV